MKNPIKQMQFWFHPYRFLSAGIGAVIFIAGARITLDTYYRYFDNYEYIQVLAPISFDKKVYHACETQIALTKFRIFISAPVQVHSRLYLMRSDKGNETEIIKEYNIESFLQKQIEPQFHTVNAPLPCDLKPGVYFYRGLFEYAYKGFPKSTPFSSEQFTIEELTPEEQAE